VRPVLVGTGELKGFSTATDLEAFSKPPKLSPTCECVCISIGMEDVAELSKPPKLSQSSSSLLGATSWIASPFCSKLSMFDETFMNPPESSESCG